MANDVLDQAEALADRTIDFRRALHRRPEIGLQLPGTQEAIVEELSDLGLDVRRGGSTTSVVAVVIRADLICPGVQSGCRATRSAADPATCGEDIDVPAIAWK